MGNRLKELRKAKGLTLDELSKELKNKYPKKTIFELVTIIVYQPAPKFYLTPRTIEEFIYRIKKKNRQLKMKQ